MRRTVIVPDRSVRPPAPQPPHLGHRPLQPPVPVLHAGGGVRLAPAGIDPHLRGDRPAGGIFAGLGVTKVRLTGGEPLLRHDLPALVSLLSRHDAITDLALTTNGVLLARQAEALRAAGLRRVTVSLDTLRPERMQEFARSARHADVIAGIDAARAAGFTSVKLNTVVIRGYNDDEVAGPARVRAEPGTWSPASSSTWTWAAPPAGPWTRWSRSARSWSWWRGATVRWSRSAKRSGRRPSGSRCRTARVFGVIASTTAPFCRTCDRGRLTADGTFLLCLYGEKGLDLRELLRGGAGGRGDRRDASPACGRRAARPRRGGAGRSGRAGRPPPDREPARRSPARDAHPRRLMAPPGRAHPAPDPAQHREHRPALRRDRRRPPPDRAAGLLARGRRPAPRRPRLLGRRGPLAPPRLVRVPGRDGPEPLPLLLRQGRAQLLGRALPGQQLPRVRQRDRGDARRGSWRSIRSAASPSRCRDRCAA